MKQRTQQSKAAGWAAGSSKYSSFGAPAGTGGSLSYLAEPPSLAAISDPKVVVFFKNALKKDSITKAKALEDLLQYAQAHPHDQEADVEEAVLEVWAEIYPRTSIDNSRRVRELSHTLQCELMRSTRKRMEKFIPKVVGAWLAGPYDRDRVAARAANEGFVSLLTSPERRTAFWRKCQPQILDYAIDAIRETADTLSDERSTTKEDMDAKYFRVITASLSLALGLLEKLEDADISKLGDKYHEYFSEETVWKSFTFGDPVVRKTVCQLLVVCLNRKLPYADSPQTRQAIVIGGLKTTQSGSAMDYVRALARLTQVNPDIWKPSPKEKKPALVRLHQFIAKGSQGCPASFWEHLERLLSILPEDQLRDRCTALDLLSAVKSGVMHREEPRTHAAMAWRCHINTARRLVDLLSADDGLVLVREQVFPLLDHFLFSLSERPTLMALGIHSINILVEAHLITIQSTPSFASASEEEWNRLADLFCAKISGSLPEVSREFQSSQEKIGEEGRRWFALVGDIHKKLSPVGQVLPDQTSGPSHKIIAHCISLLESRNLKPFGAAQILEYALSTAQHLFLGEAGQRTLSFLRETAGSSMEKVMKSASARPLLSCLRLLSLIASQEANYEKAWKAWIAAALDYSDDDASSRATVLAALVSQEKASRLCQVNARLQQGILNEAAQTIRGNANSWELLVAAVTYHGLTDESCKKLAQDLAQTLEQQPQLLEVTLRALEIVVKGRPQLFSQDEALHTSLVAQLLGLSEISDGVISSKALAIRSLLDGDGSISLPVISIIQSNLERAGPQSLEVSTLVMQAKQAFDANVPVEEIFPSTNVWMQKLAPLLEQPLNPSLSITSSIGGVATLSNSKARRLDLRTMPRDRKGRSVPLRMALYAGQLLEENLDRSALPSQFQIELLFIQCLTLQLATDQLTSRDHNGLWFALDEAQSAAEAEAFVAGLRHSINKSSLTAKWWDQGSDDEASRVFRGLVSLMKEECRQLTPRGVYSARALGEIISSLVEAQGLPVGFEEAILGSALTKAAPETALVASAFISGLGESLQPSTLVNTFFNRLVSDVAGLSVHSDKTLMTLSLLTLAARIYEPGELPVASNRIVFAVRQVTSWLKNEDADDDEDEDKPLEAPLCAEICRVLTVLLPCMGGVFGSYWEKTIDFCIELWEKAAEYPLPDALPFIHASLKLMKALEAIPDANDDLQDALRASASKRAKSLVELLKLPRGGGSSQPLDIVDAMLCREIQKINAKHISDMSAIFELVASESHDIQTAAFCLLHRTIPAEQEQRSLETLLDKTDARLPDELLSLLLDAPTLEKFSDEMLAQFPSSIRSYLLSWKLVFDTYSTSAFKMRNDLTEHLKTENHMSHLLDFMFDVLGHSAAHPLPLEREHLTTDKIRDYDVDLAESEPEERSMQWLLVHLFYLTLKYVPGLFKTWYLDCRSKQTRIAVEAWTARYFSPLIISDTLDEVQSWGETQGPAAADEQELVVRVSKTAREVTAGYEVDEAHGAIAIRMPSSYPLDSIAVSGVSRVAVSERKWQSWIMTTQGVITFSGGNIIDGLQVFRRNVNGALKGQTECAICYSIISTDKRTPEKKCGTCKNLFHRTCLYKWFQTSNQNTCPLCRNPIDYLGSDTAKRRQGREYE